MNLTLGYKCYTNNTTYKNSTSYEFAFRRECRGSARLFPSEGEHHARLDEYFSSAVDPSTCDFIHISNSPVFELRLFNAFAVLSVLPDDHPAAVQFCSIY